MNTNIGFDPARFPALQEDFICPICHGVLNMPILTPCGHVFCEECVTGWVTRNRRCPVCQLSVHLTEIRNAPFILKNLLSSLKIRCTHAGCTNQNLVLETITTHESSCDHAPGKCPNLGCNFAQIQPGFKRMHLQRHLLVCEWRELPCPNNCGDVFLCRELSQHTERACPNEKVWCPLKCGATLNRRDVMQHTESECIKTTEKCLVPGCGFQAYRGDTAAWERHMAVAARQHTLVMMQKLNQQAEFIQKLQTTVTDQASLISSLQSAVSYVKVVPHVLQNISLEGPQTTIRWVMRGMTSKWEKGIDEYSPEMCFLSSDARLRYYFVINIEANGPNTRNRMGIFFVPRRGPNHLSLKWPISNHVRFTVVNRCGKEHKTNVLFDQDAKQWFSELAPPGVDNKTGPGWKKFMEKDEIDAGFVYDDSLTVCVELLSSTFNI
eukprot:c1279_g1_i1.p1 GENE.c1279_g1_i1~~c1279_g1_i1.p1  ORF type:complete len:458 (+),score=69.80 c1279_g1_i1:64-1374(+)